MGEAQSFFIGARHRTAVRHPSSPGAPMPSPDLVRKADAVRADLARLEGDLMALLALLGGAVGSALADRVREPMAAILGHVEPLLKLLGAHPVPAAPARTKRRPSRPNQAASATAAAAPSRRVGRRNRARLATRASR
ncbi:MAG: hypothetical protein U0610_13375 [bacterium]